MSKRIGSPHPVFATLRDLDSRLGLLTPGYWLTGLLFLALYLVVERSTLLYQLDGLGITLWSPSAGLSLTLLLMRGTKFAPFVFVGSLAAETFVYTGPRGPAAMIGTSLVLALGLLAIAAVCRSVARQNERSTTLADVLALLIIAPLGALLIAFAYCTVLYAAGLLTGWRFFIAVRNQWIGDTLGMITLAPAVPVLLSQRWLKSGPSRGQLIGFAGFGLGLSGALWAIFGVKSANEYQFFYLLFLPIIWVAIRAGYGATALALLVTHLALVTSATHSEYAAYDFIGIQMLMLVLSATGLILGIVMTERGRSAEKLRQQQGELSRAVRHATVGAMGAALAHEISQPMASAANYLHAARRLLRARGEVDGPVAQALAKSEAESSRARMALERVRDYVSTGRIEPGPVDVEGLLGKVVALLEKEARMRGVALRSTISPHLPRLLADPVQTELLLVNLVSNAIDAASSNGDSSGDVCIHARHAGDRIALEVSDNGPGITADIAERIFEPFETTKAGGMGLGLTVARQIVDAHGGGLVWQVGKPCGARFIAELPVDGPAVHGP